MFIFINESLFPIRRFLSAKIGIIAKIRDIKKFKLKNSHKGVDFYDNHYRKK